MLGPLLSFIHPRRPTAERKTDIFETPGEATLLQLKELVLRTGPWAGLSSPGTRSIVFTVAVLLHQAALQLAVKTAAHVNGIVTCGATIQPSASWSSLHRWCDC